METKSGYMLLSPLVPGVVLTQFSGTSDQMSRVFMGLPKMRAFMRQKLGINITDYHTNNIYVDVLSRPGYVLLLTFDYGHAYEISSMDFLYSNITTDVRSMLLDSLQGCEGWHIEEENQEENMKELQNFKRLRSLKNSIKGTP